ncbi:hypothetical protein KSP40_PGU001252 [Platanthera guangdongensis]|uniref:LisH domain-containing protein n=1 Tax=Platanthera guangdongensis TaxID=2320717 RepID=A0ABR2LK43_9ASPA
MAKQGRGKKHERLGTGMVTPMQIAFIVDRYLSDNCYTQALSNFRAEASDLLSRTHGKEVPKGLMGLADILDDYIRLKEQRLAMDREKQRVDAAMRGMQDVIRLYHSDSAETMSTSLATSLPQIMASPAEVPLLCSSNPRNGSQSGNLASSALHFVLSSFISDVGKNRRPKGELLQPRLQFFDTELLILSSIICFFLHLEYYRFGDNTIHGASTINISKPLLLPPKDSNARFSAPVRTQSSAEKRKASKLKEAPSMKKLRTHSPCLSNIEQELGSCSLEAFTNRGNSLVLSKLDDNSTIKPPPLKGPSVVKELFKHPDNYQPNTSSPKTPPQPLASQMDKSLSPSENSIITAVERSCSLISSETIIISPLKNKGYYAVERSYQVTCSPLKTSATKLSKRENVKGRLDFDKFDAFERIEAPCPLVDKSTSSPSDAETPGGLEFDLTDFEIFDGDFLSGLLVDFDVQTEKFSGGHSDVNSMITGYRNFPFLCTIIL